MIESGTKPSAPTSALQKYNDGRVRGTDGSVWLYRAIPLAPVVDTKAAVQSLLAAEPVMGAIEELSAMTIVRSKRRRMAKGTYRPIHLLTVNIPARYRPPANHPNAIYLASAYGKYFTTRRVVLMGTKLRENSMSHGLRSGVDSLAQQLSEGQLPLEDFDDDYTKVSAAFDRSGLQHLTPEEVRLADSWWAHGRAPDSPMLVHANHSHFFEGIDGMRVADNLGPADCADWGDTVIPGEHALSFMSVRGLDVPFLEVFDGRVQWAVHMMQAKDNARAISVRGLIEPSKITREEIRRQRKRFLADLNERYTQNKMSRSEQEEMTAMLGEVEELYAGGNAPPTIIDTSIIAAFDGDNLDPMEMLPAWTGVELSPLLFRQSAAFEEMQMCSNIRANSFLLDLPAQAVTHAGLMDASVVGDTKGNLALLGLVENGRQPAYVSSEAAYAGDSQPLMLIAGQTGSGKSVTALSLVTQWASGSAPVLIIDPKPESDFSEPVQAMNGQVASLDDLVSADGIFDPLRFADSPEIGIETATSMLIQINPWGHAKADMEVPIQSAIAYGVGHGATCTGQALQIAQRDIGSTLPEGMLQRVFDLINVSPLARACIGFDPQTEGLRIHDGITLIKVGKQRLEQPPPGRDPESLTQRLSVVLLRMMVFGSMTALAKRDGVLMLDEAWMFLAGEGSKFAVEEMGRLARLWKVLPILLSQRITDFINAGLMGYFSRGLILPISDEDEALAALHLYKIEATEERLARLMAPPIIGNGAPNWDSMRALRHPDSDAVLRGTIGIYCDLAGRAVPTEIILPSSFLERISSRPDDIRRREEKKQTLQAIGLLDSTGSD